MQAHEAKKANMHKQAHGRDEPLVVTRPPRGGGHAAEGDRQRLGNEREVNCFDTADDLGCQQSLF